MPPSDSERQTTAAQSLQRRDFGTLALLPWQAVAHAVPQVVNRRGLVLRAVPAVLVVPASGMGVSADLNSQARRQKGHRCSCWAASHLVMHCSGHSQGVRAEG